MAPHGGAPLHCPPAAIVRLGGAGVNGGLIPVMGQFERVVLHRCFQVLCEGTRRPVARREDRPSYRVARYLKEHG